MAHRRPKVKLTKIEKIERDIRLQLRKQDRAVTMQGKAAKMLKSSALALAKLHRQRTREETKAANTAVETAAPPPPPIETAKPKPGTVGEAIEKVLNETLNGKAKRKRPSRKAPLGSEARGLQLTPPQSGVDPKRMEEMGFRPYKRKRNVASESDKT